MRYRSLLFTLPLLALACSDEATPDDPGVLEAQQSESELLYLRDASEVASAFSTGSATLVPTRSFSVVDLVLTFETVGAMEFAVFADGQWGEWAALMSSGEDAEDRFRRATIELGAPAQAIALRSDGGQLEFARMEFFASLAPEHDHHGFNDDRPYAEGHDDDSRTESEAEAEKAARNGRWQLTGAVQSAAANQYVAYEGAPPYNGGRNCGGSLLPGTRELGQYLVNNFPGARSFQGYNCRQIRGSSGMSLHGTGRALDIFVPLDGGQADNDLGDPVAHWLIENAEAIGIQLIIWDRSIWSGGRRSNKFRSYGGAHPHHDHLHIELNAAGGNRRTAFFNGGANPPPAGGNPPPAGNAGCHSSTLGRRVTHGELVQMSYDRCGGTCQWAICNDGSWDCGQQGSGGTEHGNPACAPAEPVRAACTSQTLGRQVPDGESVQMAYDACGGTCQWARCSDGGWVCEGGNPAGSVTHAHAQCQPAAAPAGDECYSRTLGRGVPHGDRVQMAYAACADQQRCNWAVCDDGTWLCTGSAGSGQDHPHQLCQ